MKKEQEYPLERKQENFMEVKKLICQHKGSVRKQSTFHGAITQRVSPRNDV